jgi:hypothetical protein
MYFEAMRAIVDQRIVYYIYLIFIFKFDKKYINIIKSDSRKTKLVSLNIIKSDSRKTKLVSLNIIKSGSRKTKLVSLNIINSRIHK